MLDMHFKDVKKPDGEACNADGTLKDANEIQWLNSPSDEQPILPSKRFYENDDVDYQDDDEFPTKKLCVSINHWYKIKTINSPKWWLKWEENNDTNADNAYQFTKDFDEVDDIYQSPRNFDDEDERLTSESRLSEDDRNRQGTDKEVEEESKSDTDDGDSDGSDPDVKRYWEVKLKTEGIRKVCAL